MYGKASQFLSALLALLPCAAVWAAGAEGPPRFAVAAPAAGKPLTFVVYGDPRFSRREDISNSFARRSIVERIAGESPAAILIGGDLVYQGSDPDDYATYRRETAAWSQLKIPVFPALGNHEFKGCPPEDVRVCLENWWLAFSPLPLSPYRWYSLTLGPTLLALILDTDAPLKPGSEQLAWFDRQITGAEPGIRFILVVLHYPPVRDPLYPRMADEREVARYFSAKAKSLHARLVVVGSHVHNYERYSKDGVTYLVSGGGGATPVPAPRMFGELSQLRTAVNFHYLRFTLERDRLTGIMVRFDADKRTGNAWSEPDRVEVRARD